MGAPFVREHVFNVLGFLHSLEMVEDLRVELSPADVCWYIKFNGGCRIIVDVVRGVKVCGLVEVLGRYDCDSDSNFAEVVGERTWCVGEPLSYVASLDAISAVTRICMSTLYEVFTSEGIAIRCKGVIDPIVCQITKISVGGVEELIDVVWRVNWYCKVERGDK